MIFELFIILSMICIINNFESDALAYLECEIHEEVFEVHFFLSLIKGGNCCSIFGGEMQIFYGERKCF